MRTLLAAAAVAAMLAACSPPAQQKQDETPPAPPPAEIACNSLAPDAARQIAVQEPLAAVASADLRGGAIPPGLYDLTSARRIGAATGWTGTRAVALEVAEASSGVVTLNWAGADPSNGYTDRWTATLTDTPQTRLSYSCGRIGEVAAQFAVSGTDLQLRLPDGANGSLDLHFARRS
ncbi:MAG: hypothetical protein JNJ63_12800 [Hyphomonadaceae bacterium]|nr:hypothetical protein [Hyphomonadaceae bacterium]